MMDALLFSYKVSRGMHTGLDSGVTGFCFDSKLRKCSEDLFFLVTTKENRRPLQKLLLQRHWNSAQKSHCTRTAKIRDKQAVWKLLSEISRTVPGLE